MMHPPAYFDHIWRRAVDKWELLDSNPDLAGPTHQLFNQVKQPRHVLSEFLQNADDAGATEAAVQLDQKTLVMEHNGDDFSNEHFQSLCTFANSNKRTLHTIGFRGLGFKSFFSLGNSIFLSTPSLSVRFDQPHFDVPLWIHSGPNPNDLTRISVTITDSNRQQELEASLAEWLDSPVALLFFRNIRSIRFGDHEIRWRSESGPVPDSQWMTRPDCPDDRYLLIRSSEYRFPSDALDEIRQERGIQFSDDSSPSCTVEVVLGAPGRLYTVLPTDVKPPLPFACNAPFVQYPDRNTIKPPNTSPTNRWLLGRLGTLAATAMRRWLEDDDLPTAVRAQAYGLLPDVDPDDSSIAGFCRTAVQRAFADLVVGKPILLASDGRLADRNEAVSVPTAIHRIWTPQQIAKILGNPRRLPLSHDIDAKHQEKLYLWGLCPRVQKQDFLAALRNSRIPKPHDWKQLLHLWRYVADSITAYGYAGADTLAIVPAYNQEYLFPSKKIVRLREKRPLHDDGDWAWLTDRLDIFDPDWIHFLETADSTSSDKYTTAERAVLSAIGLDDSSDSRAIVRLAAERVFADEQPHILDCVRLAQIAAHINAPVGSSFRYVTRRGSSRSVGDGVMYDSDGFLRDMLPEEQRDSYLLHQNYTTALSSCSSHEWRRWFLGGRSGLDAFVRLTPRVLYFTNRTALDTEIRRRGTDAKPISTYSRPKFAIDDLIFDDKHWRYWCEVSSHDAKMWSRVLEHIVRARWQYSRKVRQAHVKEMAVGWERRMRPSALAAGWVVALRDVPCVPGTDGAVYKPRDVFRRTSETEALMGLVPFVRKDLDQESNRDLLDMLGVRSTAIGPDLWLDRLRSLADAGIPSEKEAAECYRGLDRVAGADTSKEAGRIKEAFSGEKLIFTRAGRWVAASDVFLRSSEDGALDAELILAPVAHLALWTTVGVADRPTLAWAMRWLRTVPVGRALEQEEAKRISSLLAHHTGRIWNDSQHWLNLAREWVPVDQLSFSLTARCRIPWEHLDGSVRQRTADLRRLSDEAAGEEPFSQLRKLESAVKDRLDQAVDYGHPGVERPWLTAVGRAMCCVALAAHQHGQGFRELAERLSRTTWCETPGLKVTPYIGDEAVGNARLVGARWLGNILHVDRLPSARLARQVPRELGAAFQSEEVRAALHYCFGRSEQDVLDYFRENFGVDLRMDPSDRATADDEGQPTDGREPPTADADANMDQQDRGSAGTIDDALPDRDAVGGNDELRASTGGSFTRDRALAKQNVLARQLKGSLKGEIIPDPSPDGTDADEATAGAPKEGLGDKEYREAVVRYEIEAGREPSLGKPHQPGWDVRSVDPKTGIVRLIEVKGKGCAWDDDEVVELTRAQMRHAFKAEEDWYLYVVERTDPHRYRVLPIPNPAHAAAKWILAGEAWRMTAEDARVVTILPDGPGDCSDGS